MLSTNNQVLEDYRRDGVIVKRGLYSSVRINEINVALQHYYVNIAPGLPASDVTFEADGKTVRNLWRMDRHDPYFAKLAADPDLLKFVGELVNGEAVLMGVETFNKPAKIGSGVPAHQDNAYFCRMPADVLTIWIAIDPVTPANGPVFYVRGTQSHMLPHRPSGVSGNSMGLDAEVDRNDPLVGTLEPGDALIHHCQVVHYSAPNTTDHPRCGLLMVFRGSHTEIDLDLKNQYQIGNA